MGMTETAYKYIREAELDDIICLCRDRAWFLAYEDRNRYKVITSFKDIIILIDGVVWKLIREYENKYGVKIPISALRRYIRG